MQHIGTSDDDHAELCKQGLASIALLCQVNHAAVLGDEREQVIMSWYRQLVFASTSKPNQLPLAYGKSIPTQRLIQHLWTSQFPRREAHELENVCYPKCDKALTRKHDV